MTTPILPAGFDIMMIMLFFLYVASFVLGIIFKKEHVMSDKPKKALKLFIFIMLILSVVIYIIVIIKSGSGFFHYMSKYGRAADDIPEHIQGSIGKFLFSAVVSIVFATVCVLFGLRMWYFIPKSKMDKYLYTGLQANYIVVVMLLLLGEYTYGKWSGAPRRYQYPESYHEWHMKDVTSDEDPVDHVE